LQPLPAAFTPGLPDDYRAALAVIVAVARREPPIAGFAAWPLCTFVEIFGLSDPDASLAAMEHLTRRASCEFAIRPFLRDHWDAAYATMERFTEHADEAVRRLPSEGTRPQLPWGTRVARLTADPLPGLAILERLRHDPSPTVRRSVANHLNDIAKERPELVIETVRRWGDESATDPRMISHAMRTLVKQGSPEALAVLGFTTETAIAVARFVVEPSQVTLGDQIELWATMKSESAESQRLVVDFAVHHVTKSGALSAKVFKWATVALEPGETRTLTKRRVIRQASTRTYYPGIHRVELLVAGTAMAEDTFEVVI